VQVGNNELDYVAQDVTVRYFTPKFAPRRVGERHVEYIGEDVTVRYFTPKLAPRVRVGDKQIHYISEDVTVPPKHAVTPPPLPVRSAPQPVDP